MIWPVKEIERAQSELKIGLRFRFLSPPPSPPARLNSISDSGNRGYYIPTFLENEVRTELRELVKSEAAALPRFWERERERCFQNRKGIRKGSGGRKDGEVVVVVVVSVEFESLRL